MVTIRQNHATRPTDVLIKDFSHGSNDERFSQEMDNCLNLIDIDSNRTIQIIGRNFMKGGISNNYAKKAIELVHLDSEDLKEEVLSTDQTVKEGLWSHVYDVVLNNP
jgi:hypothetical protein